MAGANDADHKPSSDFITRLELLGALNRISKVSLYAWKSVAYLRLNDEAAVATAVTELSQADDDLRAYIGELITKLSDDSDEG